MPASEFGSYPTHRTEQLRALHAPGCTCTTCATSERSKPVDQATDVELMQLHHGVLTNQTALDWDWIRAAVEQQITQVIRTAVLAWQGEHEHPHRQAS